MFLCFWVSDLFLDFPVFLKLMLYIYIEVSKTDVNMLESYYMHLYYLRENFLGSYNKNLILIKD